MFESLPIPLERLAPAPSTDKFKVEDDAQQKKVDDSRREAPKEPFDSHLHKFMPAGWAPSHASSAAMPGETAIQSVFQGPVVKPAWLLKALGDLDDAPQAADQLGKPVVLHVLNPLAQYHDHEILSAVKEGAPIHEAHFPGLFVAQLSQMQQKGETVTKLAVQIAPEDLGKLHMTFTLKQQTVSVSVIAANQQAKEALERQFGAIQSILNAHQIKPTELKVEVANMGMGAGNNGGQSSEGESGYQAPNRWLIRRAGDLEEGIDVTVG